MGLDEASLNINVLDFSLVLSKKHLSKMVSGEVLATGSPPLKAWGEEVLQLLDKVKSRVEVGPADTSLVLS